MKRFSAAALILVGLALPAFAQRSASRGGFSGHAAPAFHGGFGASAPHRFAGSSRPGIGAPLGATSGFHRGASGNSGVRPVYAGARRHRIPYVSAFGTGNYYGASAYGVAGWPSLAYPDTIGYDDSPAPQGYNSDAQPPAQEQSASPSPYQPGSNLSQPAPKSEDAVTLVFKDGRPSEQIHNYVLTRSTLYVGDQHRPDIPVDQLDLAATVKLNRDAGVDFHLPEAAAQ